MNFGGFQPLFLQIFFLFLSLLSFWDSYYAFMYARWFPPVSCVLNHFSCVWLFATLWTVTCQAPMSMGFSRQEYWSGLPCPPGGSSHPGIEPASLTSPALAIDKLFFLGKASIAFIRFSKESLTYIAIMSLFSVINYQVFIESLLWNLSLVGQRPPLLF